MPRSGLLGEDNGVKSLITRGPVLGTIALYQRLSLAGERR